jgi:tetratricopeptide (TPR) repeat protein
MSSTRLFVVAAGLLLAIDVAIACGPFFPQQLLDDRGSTLKATPKNSFAFEVQHLLPPPKDKLHAVEYSDWDTTTGPSDFANADGAGLTKEQQQALTAMRAAKTDGAADAAGEVLPQSVRMYTTGAIDFNNGQYDVALKHFQNFFVLSDSEARARGVWAAYMMGRTDLRLDDPRAVGAFQLARNLALHGAPDPLGLAVASFGDEAQIHFTQAMSALSGATNIPKPGWPDPKDPQSPFGLPPPVDRTFDHATLANAGLYATEMGQATALYAEQAVRGSNHAVQSLRIVAENILAEPARTDATIANPLIQRLLVAYVLARVDDTYTQPHQYDNTTAPPPDAGLHIAAITPNPLLDRVVGSIERVGIENPPGADRLAALAYRLGRYDLAARLAKRIGTPLASWVEAKLALQRGDLAGAEQRYAEASRGFATFDDDNKSHVRGEAGTVALARGEYLDAMAKLYPVASTYWGDVAFIAERVLTLDELKSFVDANVPPPHVQRVGDGSAPANGPPSTNYAQMLRDLLGRRLVRAGRYDEADDYLSDIKTRDAVKAYADALGNANSDWGRVDRAEGFYQAAVLARDSGMEMMGTEAVPDGFWVGGDYTDAIGRDSVSGPYVTKDEAGRVAASKVVPNKRFHYRYVAMDEANRAADLLPPRSQAYAAVLCEATGWMLSSDDDAAVHALYLRYLKNGAHVAFAKHFGHHCPAPDFDGAIHLERVQPWRDARHWVSKHRVLSSGIGAGLIAVVVALLFFTGVFAPIVRRFGNRGN